MALDSRYFVSIDLEEYFPSNNTGNPLSNGTLEFWQDNNRTNPKPVYELTGAPPNYTYTQLPNPVTLSAVGTPVDNSGNNVAIYYYPYDQNGDLDLYYVVAKDSSGTVQFTRQAWPNVTTQTNPAQADSDISNELTNPQFVEVNFSLSNPMTITISGAGTTTSAIAPGWDLVTTTTGASTVIVQRNAVAGSSAYPSNPPFTLSITPGSNVSDIKLRQRLLNNPEIFAPAVANAENGYASASVLLAPLSSVTIQYQPNGLTAQTLLTANNTSGIYSQFNATVQLSPASNPSTGDSGYVDYLVVLPTTGTTTLTNLQLVGLNSNVPSVSFDQTTANRQRDQTFNYYEPYILTKQIQSYLTGWNFGQNPAQFPSGSNVTASSAGVNTSAYFWDQTIVFQSANQGPSSSRGTCGSLRITATNTTQFAIVQYLPVTPTQVALNQPMSINIAALTNQLAGITATANIFYTTDVSLPSVGSNNSLVGTLNSTGDVATFHGNWTAVPRSGLGPAQCTIGTSSTTNFNDYGFNGWDMQGIAACNTATFLAVVVGFGSLTAANYIDIGSVSLVPGNIPCRPGPLSNSLTLLDCSTYYAKSFQFNQGAVQNSGLNTGEYYGTQQGATGGNYYMINIDFTTRMNTTPTMTLYNPGAASAQIFNVTGSTSYTGSTVFNVSQRQCVAGATGSLGSTNDIVAVHWTADARLGK